MQNILNKIDGIFTLYAKDFTKDVTEDLEERAKFIASEKAALLKKELILAFAPRNVRFFCQYFAVKITSTHDGYEQVLTEVVAAKTKAEAKRNALESLAHSKLTFQDRLYNRAEDLNGDILLTVNNAKEIGHFEAFIYKHVVNGWSDE